MGDCTRCGKLVKGRNHMCSLCQSNDDQQYEERGEVPPRFNKKEIKAAGGYHGIVYHPTHFLAGEKGKERVDIYPMKKKSKKHHSDDYGFGVPSFIKGFEF